MRRRRGARSRSPATPRHSSGRCRTVRRCARVVPLSGRLGSTVDVRALPASDDVVRGWSALLARGARVEADDESLQHAVDGARAALLLRAGRDRPRPSADDVIALEDWGFDAEAGTAWERLSIRDRRRAARRTPTDDAWANVRAGLAAAPGGVPADPTAFLRALPRHRRDRCRCRCRWRGAMVALFPGFPAEWLGRAVAVHDVPTRHGLVSCALRWHGAAACVAVERAGWCDAASSGARPELVDGRE